LTVHTFVRDERLFYPLTEVEGLLMDVVRDLDRMGIPDILTKRED